MPTLLEEKKRVVLMKDEFEYREKLKSNSFLGFSDYQDTDAREKIEYFLAEYSSTSAVFSIVFLMEEIKLVVAVI